MNAESWKVGIQTIQAINEAGATVGASEAFSTCSEHASCESQKPRKSEKFRPLIIGKGGHRYCQRRAIKHRTSRRTLLWIVRNLVTVECNPLKVSVNGFARVTERCTSAHAGNDERWAALQAPPSQRAFHTDAHKQREARNGARPAQ